MWTRLTGLHQYSPKTSKSSLIRNPCFRYAQRVMAHTIFGRVDSVGVPRRAELFLFWAIFSGYQVDSAAFLARQLALVATKKTGDIAIGGFVTALATHFQHDLSLCASVGGSMVLGIDELIRCDMIVRVEAAYHLVLHGEQRTFPLPNTPRTTIVDEANWLLPFDPVEDVPPPVHHPAPPPSHASSSRGRFRRGGGEPQLYDLMSELRLGQQTLLSQQEEMMRQIAANNAATTQLASRVSDLDTRAEHIEDMLAPWYAQYQQDHPDAYDRRR
ncbi:hypothetical protein Dimus_039148 [Dionaea muscipula]